MIRYLVAIQASLVLMILVLDLSASSEVHLEETTGLDKPGLRMARSVNRDQDPSVLATDFSREITAFSNFGGFADRVALDGEMAAVAAPNRPVRVFQRHEGGADAWQWTASVAPTVMPNGFGSSLALDEETMVVGALNDDQVFVFKRERGDLSRWSVKAVLSPAGGPGVYFGQAVDIQGDLIVVGAPNERLPGTGFANGVVHVYDRQVDENGTWSEVAALYDAAWGDELGRAVALDGDTLAVGASGEVLIFERRPDESALWTLAARIRPTEPSYWFGSKIVLRSGLLFVANSRALADEGAVFIYQNDRDGVVPWPLVATLTAPQPSVFSFAFDIAGDNDVLAVSGSRVVHLFDRDLHGRNSWSHVGSLFPPATANGDGFGRDMAIDGATLLVADYPSNDWYDHAVIVYRRSGTRWLERPLLSNSAGPAGPASGSAVAMSGDLMVVGAPGAEPGGRITVLSRNAGDSARWGASATLTGSPDAAFGASVAIRADLMAAGAPGEEGTGVVHLYRRRPFSDHEWQRVHSFRPSGLENGARFGAAVALGHDLIAIGMPMDAVAGAGRVEVFQRDLGGPDQWGLAAVVSATDAHRGDEFGTALAWWGDVLAVGAPGFAATGAVFVFGRDWPTDEAWGSFTRLNGAGPVPVGRFGASLAMARNSLAVGAPGAAGSRSSDAAVHLFRRAGDDPSTWYQTWVLQGPDAEPGDRYGASLAMLEDLLAVGAPEEVGGRVHVYDKVSGLGSGWVHTATLTRAGVLGNDAVGAAVALQGRELVVGAPGTNDGRGAVSVFDLAAPMADLSCEIDNARQALIVDLPATWEIVVGNQGPDDVSAATVTASFEFFFQVAGWSCAPKPGSGPGTSCPPSGRMADLTAGIAVDLEAGDEVRFLVTGAMPSAQNQVESFAAVRAPAGVVDPVVINDRDQDVDPAFGWIDYGDAPDPSYPTLDASNGAAHGCSQETPTVMFGAGVDAESDGRPSQGADADWDDGVLFLSSLVAGEMATVEVDVVTSSQPAMVGGWMDFNADGDWLDDGELIAGLSVTTGTYEIQFPVPASAVNGSTYARFRIAKSSIAGPDGVESCGEVEDSKVDILNPVVFRDGFASGDTALWSGIGP